VLDFARYLEAKRTVDDRALNRVTLDRFRLELTALPNPRVLELGAGIGSMVERLVDWGVLSSADYTLLDVDPALLARARERLEQWAEQRGALASSNADGSLRIRGAHGLDLTIRTRAAELERLHEPGARYDAVIACAVLDLVDVPSVLPALWPCLEPHGSFWFCINFDGETVFTPEDPLDSRIFSLYHRTMDERRRGGARSGDSRTGRHLFEHLRRAGARILASGSSDWVVFADSGKYPAREAEFLLAILAFIEDALAQEPALDSAPFADWLDRRRAQVTSGELVYLAHQLDFVGLKPVQAGERSSPDA